MPPSNGRRALVVCGHGEEKLPNGETIRHYTCDHIGVAGTTEVFTRQMKDGTWEARVGIAIMGMTNMKDHELEGANPFDEKFRDNYSIGKGATEQEALDALKADMKSIAQDLMW